MKRKILLVVLTIAAVTGVFWKLSTTQASFNPNNVLGDGVFDNANSMSAAQIDSWLNSNFPNSCISTHNGFSAPDPTGYSPNPSQFFYSSSPVSAGQVVYDAAQAYGINPQVLLSTLEKEESLVVGGAGCASWQYASALGYGCTDSGTNTHTYSYPGGGLVTPLYYIYGNPVNSITNSCVNSGPKTGFSEQVIHASWLLSFSRHKSEGQTNWAVIKGNWNNCDDNDSCPAAWNIPASDACYSGYMTQGTFKRCPTDSSAVFYDGYATIDGSSVHMDDGATASLYVYTPHLSGNQSFDNIFSSWFGSLTGLDYSWSYIGTSFSSGSGNVAGNSQVTITVTAQNTGNQSWRNNYYPIRLATADPTDHLSPLYDSSWVSPTRPATLNESLVMPGQNGTFTFKANVPNVQGFYSEHFNLVAEGSTWMPDIGFEIDLNITQATYKWQMVSQSSNNSFTLHPNDTAQFTLVAKNTGNTTWSNTNNPVRLATWNPSYRTSPFNPNDGSWPSPYRATTLQEASVAPGQNGTFVFNVKAPSTPGFYTERFNLVMEGVSWFVDPWMEFDVAVGNFYTWQMVSQTSSTGSFVLNKGQTAQFTLKTKNTGNMTWTNGANPVRLATWNPSYRASPFNPNDGSWPSPYRATTLQEASVAPGQNGTFVFNVKAPNTSGTYVERFNLVEEGVAWFVDPWMEFDITVQ